METLTTAMLFLLPSVCNTCVVRCKGAAGSLLVIASAYHLCSVHVLCVCVLFVITYCVYPAWLCGRVCCVTRSTLSTLEVDMALLPVSRLTCGSWSLE